MTGPILVTGATGEERLTPEAAAARTMRLYAELLGDGGGSPAAHLTITMDRSYKSCDA
jgi:hypothetical protein